MENTRKTAEEMLAQAPKYKHYDGEYFVRSYPSDETILQLMKEYAKQEAELKVKEFKDGLYKEILNNQLDNLGTYKEMYRSQSILLIEKLK